MGVVGIQKTTSGNNGGSEDISKFLNYTMVNFICPDNIDKIWKYSFYSDASLRYVEIGDNIIEIGDRAFYQCNRVVTWKISNNLVLVGSYAFYSTYYDRSYKMDLSFNVGTSIYTTIKNYAFYNTNLGSINGNLGNIGDGAFNTGRNTTLSGMNVKIVGSIGNSAFRYTKPSPDNFVLSRDSNITSIGDYAFNLWNISGSVGYLFDLRNSTFVNIGNYAFMEMSNGAIFYLPNTLSSIGVAVFASNQNCTCYFSSSSPPAIESNTFSNYTGNIFVPYNNINAYKTTTNWTSVAQYIKGWAPENTFSVGETLPTVNQEGYGLTWYTDRECTTQISVVVDADVELYCVASAGSVVDPVFENNDWSTIRQVVRMGIADQYWSVGDTKQITLTDSSVVTYRIVDMQAGRYALADGSGYSNMVLEPVDIFAYTYMNTASDNSGGFATSSLRTALNSGTYNRFPQDVRDAMSEVVVLSGTGDGTTTGVSSSNNHLFIAAETEMFASNTYSIGTEEDTYGLFDYYSTHTSASDRIKTGSGSSSYYLRSPMSGNNVFFCIVTGSGGIGFGNPVDIRGYAPCFAI